MAKGAKATWTPEVIVQMILALFPLILELIKMLQGNVTPAQAKKLNKMLDKVENIPSF